MLSMNNINAEHIRSTKRTLFDFTSQLKPTEKIALRFVATAYMRWPPNHFFFSFPLEMWLHLPARFTVFTQYGNRSPNSLETRRISFFFSFSV